MAYTTIDAPTDYFNTVLWSGNGTDDRSITGVGFQPDWVWYKERSAGGDNTVFDSIRGAGVRLFPGGTDADNLDANSLQAFETDGFQIGTNADVNDSGQTYVAWNWLAGGTASSNTDGDITSSVSANTTAGFSIVSYTGNGTNGATVGHGLGVTPDMIITKNRTDSGPGWPVYHSSTGSSGCTFLNSTDAFGDYSGGGYLRNPNSSTFETYFTSSGTSVNGSSKNHIAYCFAEKKGYSKFGSYTGNGNSDGTFVYTGFKPAFLLWKKSSASGTNWVIFDNKRDLHNKVDNYLIPNLSLAEGNSDDCDFLSNGFKWRSTGSGSNGSSASFIFMAFAENPFVTSTGIPTTAR